MIVDGKRMGLYHEDGTIAVVEVLEDNSDEKWTRFTLKMVRLVRPSKMFKDPEVGEEWPVDVTKGDGAAYVGWHLEEEGSGVEREVLEGQRSN